MEKKLQKSISYILQFIDSSVFMASSLSNLAIIFLKEFIELNVNLDAMVKNVKHVELNISFFNYFLKYKNFKDNLIEYKSFCRNKNYQNKFDKKLNRGFFKTYKFSNHDTNKFILLLRRYLSLRIYG